MIPAEESPSPRAAPPSILWRQVAWISLAAAALIAATHLIPGRSSLSHMDFIPGGPDAVEFCDPQNPKVIAVAAKQSSVTVSLAPATPLTAGNPEPSRVLLTLRTASGKAVGPDDLVASPGGRVRLFIVSADLADFQTVQPAPAKIRGDWSFELIPKTPGIYRVFADMTPVATGRELYASADLTASGTAPQSSNGFSSHVRSEGFAFELRPSRYPLYAHRMVSLRLTIVRLDGAAVPLMAFQGAYAHLVIFDSTRNGFLRISAPTDGKGFPPDALRPSFDFTMSFPDPGRYVAWVRVAIASRETAIPFAVEVMP
jgi:hypothetical protein